MSKSSFYWIVPAFYELTTSKSLVIDLLQDTKKILSNKVWGREINYGFKIGLEKINLKMLKDFKVHIYPRVRSGFIGEQITYSKIEEVIGQSNNPVIQKIKKSGILNNNGLLVFELHLNETTTLPKKSSDYSEDFLSYFHNYFALIEEIGIFFKISTNLAFHCEYVIMPSYEIEASGCIIIKNEHTTYITDKKTNHFGYPIIFNEKDLADYLELKNELSSIWHYNLWALKRYDLALNNENVKMENMLDLLYSLESLFEKNTSVDFMKLFCGIISGSNKKEATKHIDVLTSCFKIRNEIVHGGRHYNGMEKIKFQGKEILSQKLFWDLKLIVQKMILFAIKKLRENPEMKNLRFTEVDLMKKFYAQ
jgi:hypothetical protein